MVVFFILIWKFIPGQITNYGRVGRFLKTFSLFSNFNMRTLKSRGKIFELSSFRKAVFSVVLRLFHTLLNNFLYETDAVLFFTFTIFIKCVRCLELRCIIISYVYTFQQNPPNFSNSAMREMQEMVNTLL